MKWSTRLIITALILAVLAATAYMVWLCIDIVNQPVAPSIVSEEVQLPVPTTEATTAPTTEATVPTEAPPVGKLLNDSAKGYVCIGLRPTERSAEDRYFYAILPDQEAAIAAIESAEAKLVEGKATNGEALTGLMVEYQNGLWCFTETGALCNPWERIEPEDAAEIYALCMDAADEFGFTKAITLHDIRGITSATLEFDNQITTVTNMDSLSSLKDWLVNSKPCGPGGASCWFTAFLTLEMADREPVTIAIATDSCNTWMTEGVAYEYAANIEDMYGLFSMSAPE